MRINPPGRLGENSPPWLCITGPGYSVVASSSNYGKEESPEHRAAREAKAEAQHAAAFAREEVKRAERWEKAEARREANRIAREERSRKAQAEREARKNSPEKTLQLRMAALQRAREIKAAKLPKAPKQRTPKPGVCVGARIAPEGYLSIKDASREAHYSRNSLSWACSHGKIPTIHKGRSVYVRLEDVRAYKATTKARMSTAQREAWTRRKARTEAARDRWSA